MYIYHLVDMSNRTTLFKLLFIFLCTATFSLANGQEKSKEHYQSVLNDLLVNNQQVFRSNSGQFNKDVLYNTSGSNASASFGLDRVNFSLIKDVKFGQNQDNPFETRASFLNWSMNFVNSTTQSVIPLNKKKSNVHYFGPEAKNGRVIDEYSRLSYINVFEHTDVTFYSAQNGELKYDFILHPGAEIKDIVLDYQGINSISVLPTGELSLQTDWGEFREDKPYSYQEINGSINEVEVNYRVNQLGQVVFEVVGDYDPDYDLVIDPIYVDWSTYFYGEAVTGSYGWNYVLDIDIDDDDYIYITGMSYNQRFVSQLGGYDTTYDVGYDAFLCKITPKGDSLNYFTFIGGSSWEYSMNVAVGASHEAVISGITWGEGYPTTSGAYDEDGRTCSGTCYQGFVTKLSKNGDSLVYSTFLGGRTYNGWSIDWIRGMQVTDNGSVYLVGNTQAEDFPTTSGCYQSQYGGSSTGTGFGWWNMGDGFLTCLNSSGSALVFSTYIGGAGNDIAFDLHVVSTVEIYVVGKTNSSNFKTTPGASVFNSYIKGGSDGFIVKFKSKAKQIEFAKLMGGTGEESFEGIYANERGEPYIVGSSNSSNFPVSSTAYQKKNAGGYDLVVVKLISSGTNFRYSTYLGGGGDDGYSLYTYWFDNMSITANVKEEAIISATTKSSNFPITSDALQSSNNSLSWYGKLTISKLSYQGSQLKYGTYWGGSGGEFPGGIRAKRVGCVTFVLFAGNSYSGDYPTTTGAYKESRSSGAYWTGFVTKFRDTLYTETISLAFEDTLVECDNVFQILDAQNQGANFLWSDGWTDRYKIAKDSGTWWVQATYGCDTVRDTLTIQLEHSPKIPVLGSDTTYCDIFPSSIPLDAQNDTIYRSYLWSTAETSQKISVTSPGTYFVDISTPNCGTKTDTIHLNLLKTPIVDLGTDPIACDSVKMVLDAKNENNKSVYRWSTNDSVQSITALDTGLYWVTVSNICGMDSSAIVLDKFVQPKAMLPSDSIFCDTVYRALTGGQGLNGEEYIWSNLDGSVEYATTTDLLLTEEKDIRLEVKNKCGISHDSFLVTLLLSPENLKDSIFVCDKVDELLTIGVANNAESYSWNTGAKTSQIQVTNPGVYVGTVKNFCGADSSTIVIDLAFTPTVTLPNDSTYCGIIKLTLSALNQDPLMKYEWQDGSKLPQFAVQQAGTYWVRLDNRCGSASDTVRYNILQKPAVNLGADKVFCGGVTPFDLKVGVKDNEEVYSWSNGSTSDNMSVSSEGDHWVSIVNYCGEVRDTMNVRVSQIPAIDLGVDTILCGNFSLELDAGNPGMSYNWMPFGETSQKIQAEKQVVYSVEVTNADGCVGSGDFEIGSGCVSHVYIPSSFTPNKDGLNDRFKPTLVNVEAFTMSIYNRWGELLFETDNMEEGWDGSHGGIDVQAGVYLYSIRFITTEDARYHNESGIMHVLR